LFADGGVTALGTNVTNMALIGVAAGYATAAVLYGLARRRTTDVPVAGLGVIAFVAALVGTICAAMGFVIEYAIGGASATSLSAVAGYMFGTHALIGIGEGVITAVTVMAVARSRPDLVYLLRRARAEVPA
jgi:cobalt/nickel transport system permease protein